MSSSIYDTDRLTKIAEIMPRFSEHAEVGDEIMFGLEGDPAFPKDFENARPTGSIIRTKNTEHGKAFKVKMSTGKVVSVAPNSFDPQHVWEFTDESFQKVLERSMKNSEVEEAEEAEAEPVPSYRGSNDSEIEELRREVQEMRRSFDDEIAESRAFNNTLIATMNEMANDICKSNADAEFCKVFTSEYRSMIGSENEKGTSESPSPFDSDFSDSDSD